MRKKKEDEEKEKGAVGREGGFVTCRGDSLLCMSWRRFACILSFWGKRVKGEGRFLETVSRVVRELCSRTGWARWDGTGRFSVS